jgi:hypothetical protein
LFDPVTACLWIIALLVNFLYRSHSWAVSGNRHCRQFCCKRWRYEFLSNGCTRLQPHISGVQVLVTADIGERVCRRLSLPNIVGIVWSIATVSHHARMRAVLLSFCLLLHISACRSLLF